MIRITSICGNKMIKILMPVTNNASGHVNASSSTLIATQMPSTPDNIPIFYTGRLIYSLSALKVSVLSGDLSPGWVNLHPGEIALDGSL